MKIISHAASVWSLHAGNIKHVKLFQHKGEALEAAGLSELEAPTGIEPV